MANALTECPVGQVGLELELHLVGLTDPGRRPTWSQVPTLADGLPSMPSMPSGSLVTLEPGSQIELSTPPTDAGAAGQPGSQVRRDGCEQGGGGGVPRRGVEPVPA